MEKTKELKEQSRLIKYGICHSVCKSQVAVSSCNVNEPFLLLCCYCAVTVLLLLCDCSCGVAELLVSVLYCCCAVAVLTIAVLLVMCLLHLCCSAADWSVRAWLRLNNPLLHWLRQQQADRLMMLPR